MTGLFTALSIALLWRGDLSPAEQREFWAIAVFFGACFLFFTVPTLPRVAARFRPTIEARDERPVVHHGEDRSSELVFRPSQPLNFLVWLSAAGFVPISALMTDHPSLLMRSIGWLGVVFWSAGVLLMPVAMLRRVHQLRLSNDGFTLNRISGKSFFRWSDVSSFGVVTSLGVVGFDLAADYRRHRMLRRLGKTLFGFEATLLASPYGLSPGDLALLLTRCRRAALSGHWERPLLQLEEASGPIRADVERRG